MWKIRSSASIRCLKISRSVVSQKAHDKNLEFLIAPPNDLPPNLIGDPLRLGQILINLVNNAVKFTERGEVVVTVALEEQLADRVKVRFSVRDSGIGMTPEQSRQVCSRHSRRQTLRRRESMAAPGLDFRSPNAWLR